MGYRMSQLDTNFSIQSERLPSVLCALTDALDKTTDENKIDTMGGRQYLQDGNIDSFFEEFGWELNFDRDDNVTHIEFIGEKASPEDALLFSAIAPYVNPGSYIVMIGEDHEMWRWFFDNGKLFDQSAVITWE